VGVMVLIGAGADSSHTGDELSRMLRSLEFSQGAFLPSSWMTRGLLATETGDWADAALYLGALSATGFVLLSLAAFAGRRLYSRAYDRSQSVAGRSSRKRSRGFIDMIANRLRFRGSHLPLIIAKDVKTFIRDPVQSSQVIIFFGVLTLYIANLNRFPYDLAHPFYKNLISFLNLSATCVTLATLSTRFVYPMLSMEVAKFWILGLLPIQRSRLLVGKFIFAFVSSLLITEALVLLSNHMLRTGAEADDRLLILHLFAAGLVCFGLNGLCVGMGALFPVFGETDASKIVSSFGGTLTVVLSIGYVIFTVSVVALPCHFHYVDDRLDSSWIVVGVVVASVTSNLVGVLPMVLGARNFERMEF
jgi:ABC-2 type transport system permease protein